MITNITATHRHAAACLAALLATTAVTAAARNVLPRPPMAGAVTAERLQRSDQEPGQWLAQGRDSSGSYYSPLTSINDGNVGRLGFAWSYDLGTHRGQEATPLVIDGVMYTAGERGYVYALDAASGRELWRFDPEPRVTAMRNPCCDMVNRGVAVWEGLVYVAAVDGVLHALKADTGKEVWKTDTIVDHKIHYSSTGAPQIAGRLVVIGNSGSDMDHYGARGYVSAYDLKTGKLQWRFYTVPAAAGKPFENPALALAAKTWDPARPKQFQGGGTVWDGMSYDPKLDLLYFGTSNAAPYELAQVGRKTRDCLFTASILAVHAKDGRLAWHYQTTPHDQWDFDATQKMIFADLPMEGVKHQVLMQASKNGFYYIIDRASGKLLAADAYSYINWASGVDMKTGRPITLPQGEWHTGPKNVYPSWAGAHTWHPMSYSPQTGLTYIPVIDVPNIWVDMLTNGGSLKYLDGFFTINGIMPDDSYVPSDLAPLFGPLPAKEELAKERKEPLVRELLRAWDPLAHKTVWEVETSTGMRGYDGGVLSTAGNLVFQGRGNGDLDVYDARTGKLLKAVHTGSHIMAAPMSYSANGVQYVAVQAGYGGAAITVGPIPDSSAAIKYENVNRILVFKLDGPDVPPPPARVIPAFERPPAHMGTEKDIRRGERLFVQECSRCHVLGLSVTPDLRRLSADQHAIFKDIVLHGAVAPTGMERFDDILDAADVDAIHAYVIDEAWKAYDAQQKSTH